MFSKSKAPADAPLPPQSASPKRGGPRAAPSIISTDLAISGTLVSTGDIQIDGKIEGDIRTQSLTVGEKAFIHGEIVGEEIVVRGKVVGTIRAKRVTLSSTCHVEGTILHEALAVEAGAFFEGQCRHSSDPLGEPAPGPVVAERKPALLAASSNGAQPPLVLKAAPGANGANGSKPLVVPKS